MTHLPSKQFNTYKEGLDLELLREYCMEYGERRSFLHGKTLEAMGESAQWVAYVERGYFKYMVHNGEEGKDSARASPSRESSLQITRIVFVARFPR